GALKYALGPYGKDLATLAAKDYFFDADRWRRAYFENLTNVIPVDRQAGGKRALQDASEALARGKTLLLFPEGTRSTTGVMPDFNPGVGSLAMPHAVDILPMHIAGSYESLPKGRTLPTRRDLTVRIGPPLENAKLRRLVAGLRPEEEARA